MGTKKNYQATIRGYKKTRPCGSEKTFDHAPKAFGVHKFHELPAAQVAFRFNGIDVILIYLGFGISLVHCIFDLMI